MDILYCVGDHNNWLYRKYCAVMGNEMAYVEKWREHDDNNANRPN